MNSHWNKIQTRPFFHFVIIGFICAVIAGLVYMHDIAELRQQFIKSKQEQQALVAESKALAYRQLLLEEEVAQFVEVKVMLKEWQDKFIKYRDLDELVKEIRKAGRMNKLHFTLFKPGQDVKVNDYIKQPFYVAVTGNYTQTAQFIKQIVKLPWIVIVGNFTVSRVLQTNTNRPLSTELELDVYYLNLKK
jgi:Tfp pilus assembly protein PilO